MKKAIYTIITGNYDKLVTPAYIDQDCDYFCFTDNTDHPEVRPWKIIKIEPTLYRFMKDVYKQRFFKINGSSLLWGHDLVLYHDAYLHQVASVQALFDIFEKTRPDLLAMQHPERNCVYQEIEACRQLRKADMDDLNETEQKYRAEGVPANGGLIASGVIVRDFRNGRQSWKDFAAMWYLELSGTTHRDQIAFAAVDHRTPIRKELVPWELVIGPIFNKVPHAVKKLY